MKTFAVCPVCGERIPLFQLKDFESHSGAEYADHVEAQHPERVVRNPAGEAVAVPYAMREMEEAVE